MESLRQSQANGGHSPIFQQDHEGDASQHGRGRGWGLTRIRPIVTFEGQIVAHTLRVSGGTG